MPKHRRFTFEFTIIFHIYQNLQTITKIFLNKQKVHFNTMKVTKVRECKWNNLRHEMINIHVGLK